MRRASESRVGVRGRLTTSATLALCMFGCSMLGEDVRISGDGSCAGAKIIVDGKLKGRMDRSIVERSALVADGQHGWWGDEAIGDTVWAAGTRRFETKIRLPEGVHTITLESSAGDRLETKAEIKVYNTIKVSFADRRIRAETEAD